MLSERLPPRALDGAKVRRVDLPRAQLLVLEIRWRDEGEMRRGFLCLGPGGPTLAPTRPMGRPIDGFGKQLRNALTGSRVLAVERRGHRDQARFRRGEDTFILAFESSGLVLRDESGAARVARGKPPERKPSDTDAEVEPWEGASIAIGAPVDEEQRHWERAARRRLCALQKKLGKIEADAARANEVEALRMEANLIKAHAHAWRPGDAHVDVVDFYDPRTPSPMRRLDVDATIGPNTQADRLYHRARRYERGAVIAAEQAAKTRSHIEQLRALLQETGGEDLKRWRVSARALGVRAPKALSGTPTRHRKRSSERCPYRHFLGSGERAVYVGRGPVDNDALTLRHARPWDLWLHAKGKAGAHVVVPLEKNEPCPPQLLADAAMLAGHFSAQRAEAIIEVSHTPRRHVHKRRGDPPGAVRVRREKVIAIRMDSARVKRLLATERALGAR